MPFWRKKLYISEGQKTSEDEEAQKAIIEKAEPPPKVIDEEPAQIMTEKEVKKEPDVEKPETKDDIQSISQKCDTTVIEAGDLDLEVKPPLTPSTATFILLSFVYCKLLVVICVAYTVSEVTTFHVPLYYFEMSSYNKVLSSTRQCFFTFLYGGSILFLLYVFCYLLSGSNRAACRKDKEKKAKPAVNKSKVGMFQSNRRWGSKELPMMERLVVDDTEQRLRKSKKENSGGEGGGGSPTQQKLTEPPPPPSTEKQPKKIKTTEDDRSHGTFFLRVGALTFGLGTMIYCGLEFGQFFEIPMDSPCHDLMRGINPCLQMVFTFMQMYFIFMNSRLNIHKWKAVARFGLMHVVGTNLCIWVRVLVRESLREAAMHLNKTNPDIAPNEDQMILVPPENVTDGVPPEGNYTCERAQIMGDIVVESSPYLYPLVVEYSLIGAGVLYVMWKHIGYCPRYLADEDQEHLSQSSRRAHTKVDCVGASKGLFIGLLLLVATLIGLLVFFVLVKNEDLSAIAIYLADVSHAVILFLALIAIIIGFCRVQSLKFHAEREDELSDLLLRLSAFGLFLYAVFSAIAGSMTALTSEKHLLLLITNVLNVLQVTIQLLFMGDVWRRSVYLPEHETRKPGRQIVTFLLISNLTLWLMYTFELEKVEAHPIQLNFYGILPWKILVRITLPMAIFHRFLSAVVLADIWKNTYKAKAD